MTVTVDSESSVVTMNASQNHKFAGVSVATFALLTETATAVSSVLEMESARHLARELSNLNALMTLNVAVQVSAMLTLSVSHTPLLDQVERTLSAERTVNALQVNSVNVDSAQTLDFISILTQSLDQVERTLSAERTVIASHTNSVTLMDSAQTLEWDLSILYLIGSLKLIRAFLKEASMMILN